MSAVHRLRQASGALTPWVVVSSSLSCHFAGINTNSRRLADWGLGLGVGSGASSEERKVCPRSLASEYCSSYSSCNRLWRLSCASRSSSSTLGGLPEERNTFTGCRHDDLEWAVAVAFSRPELAAAPRLQKRVRDSPLSIVVVWKPKDPLPANSHTTENCVPDSLWEPRAQGLHVTPNLSLGSSVENRGSRP